MPQDAPARLPDSWRPVAALIETDGSRVAPALARLTAPRVAPSDLADAVHCLCLLHGHRPGMIEIARDHAPHPAVRDWLAAGADAFAAEREWLARLIVAAGPVPSTIGQTISETAILHQRHALETLAGSERRGCALGAVAALVMDWRDVRVLLDRVGDCFGLAPPVDRLADGAGSHGPLRAAPLAPDQARAFAFGMQQLLAQHRGLWELVDARAAARGRS